MIRPVLDIEYVLADDAPVECGRVVAFGETEHNGRLYMQLKGYADPIIGAQLLEQEGAYVWTAEPQPLSGPEGEPTRYAYPAVPALHHLVLVRASDVLRGKVRSHDDGLRDGNRQPPAGEHRTEGARSMDDARDASVDVGEARDDAAATVRAFQSL